MSRLDGNAPINHSLLIPSCDKVGSFSVQPALPMIMTVVPGMRVSASSNSPDMRPQSLWVVERHRRSWASRPGWRSAPNSGLAALTSW